METKNKEEVPTINLPANRISIANITIESRDMSTVELANLITAMVENEAIKDFCNLNFVSRQVAGGHHG